MDSTVKSVHFDIDDLTRDLLDHKMEKLDFASDKVQDMDFTFTKDKSHTYELEAKIHFRWGDNSVIKLETYDLREGINKLVDKVDQKVRKEVDKIQDRKT